MMIRKKLVAAVLSVLSVFALNADLQAEAANDNTLKVTDVVIEGVEGYKADEIKRLLPELDKSDVDVNKLSKQIMLVNDGKAFKVNSDFKSQGNGNYKVVVSVEDLKDDQITVGIRNTGSDATGNWRANVSYVNRDVTQSGDTLGVTYGTSLNHMKDVHQASVVYKWSMPKLGDSAYISAIYSDSDANFDNILNVGNVNLHSDGKYKDFGAHYQHNFKYTSYKKQILDVGLNYRNYNGNSELILPGLKPLPWNPIDVSETVLSATYYDVTRQKNQAFSYNVGMVRNLNGDKAAYSAYRGGTVVADDKFTIFRVGANYQYKTNSDWVFGARINAQYTNDNLTALEQLGGGGVNSVRGFREHVASGDKGILGSLEIYTPEFAKNHRFLLFTDMARLSNNEYNVGERSRTLSSWGIGYRFLGQQDCGVNVSLDYAMSMSDGGLDMGKNNRRWNLIVSCQF